MVSMPYRLAFSYNAVAPEGSPPGRPAEHVRDREHLGNEIRQQLKPFVGYPADVEHPSMCRRSMPLTASSKTKRATSR